MPRRDGTGPGGRGIGGRGQFAQGICKCPKCGHEQAHARGQPCNQTKCPKCGSIMIRKG